MHVDALALVVVAVVVIVIVIVVGSLGAARLLQRLAGGRGDAPRHPYTRKWRAPQTQTDLRGSFTPFAWPRR